MQKLFGSLTSLAQLVEVLRGIPATPPIQFRTHRSFVQAAPASSLLWVMSYGCPVFCSFWFHLSIIGVAFVSFFFYSFRMFKNFCELL